jgi:hypothetical protein
MATPKFIKNISRIRFIRILASSIGTRYIEFIKRSCEWQVRNLSSPEQLISEGSPFIVCFWHGRLLMMSHAWAYDRSFRMLISTHADGQLISKIIQNLGFKTINGSSQRGGSHALRKMTRALTNGDCIGLTPDGPRGPYMQAGMGAVILAKLSGVPILPLTYSVSKWRVLGSWDKFIIPMPFSKGIFIWGEPINVSKNTGKEELEEIRKLLESKLKNMTKEADGMMGQLTPNFPITEN